MGTAREVGRTLEKSTFLPFRPQKISIFMRKNKFLYLFLFHPPLHHLHCKYGAPQNMKKSMYLGLFQNKILFQNKFLFLFCPPTLL
jgi:hypothetical protein